MTNLQLTYHQLISNDWKVFGCCKNATEVQNDRDVGYDPTQLTQKNLHGELDDVDDIAKIVNIVKQFFYNVRSYYKYLFAFF